jgi:hypothetical protein
MPVQPFITGETRLNIVLDTLPGALEYIVALNPHDFARLHNPVMRKFMSPRITLRRVAAMAGLTEAQLLAGLAGLGDAGSRPVPAGSDGAAAPALPQSPTVPPAWLEGRADADLPWVDLLPLDDTQGDPFPPVSRAVKAMPPGSVIGLRHRWQPQPLYDIWARMGLEWFARQVAPDEWRIYVYKPPAFHRKYI